MMNSVVSSARPIVATLWMIASSRDPAGRFGSAHEMAAELERHVSQTGGGPTGRTLAFCLRLPQPLFRRVFGTEWFVEVGRTVSGPPVSDVFDTLRKAKAALCVAENEELATPALPGATVRDPAFWFTHAAKWAKIDTKSDRRPDILVRLVLMAGQECPAYK